jgi:hypothetical protein
MLINFLDLGNLKKNLKNKKIKIFSKINIESLIFCKFLEIFFKKNLISFSINPVNNLDEVKSFLKTLYKKNERNKNIFFINFGAEKNLKILLSIYKVFFQNIYIIDESQFINFHNITSRKIFILNSTKNLSSEIFPNLSRKKYESVEKKFLPQLFEISRNNNILGLWLKILIWTRKYMDNFLDKTKYNKKVKKMRKNCPLFSERNLKIKKNYKKTILIYREIPLYLLGEWNLLEALLNNIQIGTFFELWKKEGIKKIAKFFLRIGLTLKEASEKWKFLTLKKKKNFQKNMEKESQIFGFKFESIEIFKIIFPVDILFKGKEASETSAFDFILSLETLSDFKLFCFGKNNQKKGFWNSYKSFKRPRNIKKGILILQKIFKFTFKMTRIILSRKIYVSERFLNYVFIKNHKNIKISFQLAKNLSVYLESAFSRFKKKNFCLFVWHKEKIWIFGFLNEVEGIFGKKLIKQQLLKLGAIFENMKTFTLLINTADCIKVQNLFR